MISGNLERMIKLADEFFEAKNDPKQISINRETTTRLKKIHPSTMSELRSKKGPIAWALIIPTTRDLMERFIAKQINEQDLLFETPLRKKYDALYLCSALVLPEHRRRGLARRLILKSIRSILKQHPIKFFFYWGFSVAGRKLAASVAREFNLPLYKRLD